MRMGEMSRREFAATMSAGVLGMAAAGTRVLAGALPSDADAKQRRPNIVVICADQHSGRYAGFAGHELVRTPHLDRIAAQGVSFSQAYCGSPVCVPGRACLMTGMYPSDVNSFCNSTVFDGSHPTWGRRMRDAGYYCWASGKLDLDPAVDLGFEGVEIEAGGHAKQPDITSLFRRPVGYRTGEREQIDGTTIVPGAGDGGGKSEKTNSSRDERTTRHAIEFFERTSRGMVSPWTAFVGYRQPHPPWIAQPKYFEYYLPRVKAPAVSIDELERLPLPYQVMRNFKQISTPIPEERMKRAAAAYFSMISELDDNIGRIYDCLERTHQLENTYIMYTSDHGESLGEHGMWMKNNLFEGAANVPFLISGPGLPSGTMIDTPVGHIDLVATLLEISGAAEAKAVRGTSLLPLLMGQKGTAPTFVYGESHSEGNPTGSFMLRRDEWKLIHFSSYGDCLFNLRMDPGEKHNLIDDPKAKVVADELRTLLHRTVDTNAITTQAFAAQEKILNGFVRTMDERQLVELFRSRLGEGQAHILAAMLKNTH
jgi:choline-sulfatase